MYKTSPIALATITSIIAFSGVAFAEDSVQPAEVTATKASGKIKVIQEKRADLREAAKDVRADFKTGAKDLRVETKEKMKAATTSTERREVKKEAVKERKDLIDTRKASTTEIRDQRKELARQHVGKIEKRYAVAIKQFDSLVTRIQSRIDKLRAKGTDVSKAEEALALAQSAIAQVKSDAQVLADLRAQVKTGDDAKSLRPQIEAAVKAVNVSIKSAHTALDKAAKALIIRPEVPKKESAPLNASQSEATGERSAAQNVVAATTTN